MAKDSTQPVENGGPTCNVDADPTFFTGWGETYGKSVHTQYLSVSVNILNAKVNAFLLMHIESRHLTSENATA